MLLTINGVKKEVETQEVIDALEALLAYDKFNHTSSIGIAKKIISDNGTNKLSSKQLSVFDNYIRPLLHPDCEEYECIGSSKIELTDLPDALLNEAEHGLICEECSCFRSKYQS